MTALKFKESLILPVILDVHDLVSHIALEIKCMRSSIHVFLFVLDQVIIRTLQVEVRIR